VDRIAVIRNIEDALADYEAGEIELASVEERALSALRTYATDFEGERRAYRASGEEPADGTVVVAESEAEARERIERLVDGDPAFDVSAV